MPAELGPDRDAVVEALRRAAAPLATLDPSAPLADLAPLRPLVENAVVVGMGGGTRGAHELFAIQHRIIRLLVEQVGFRAVAFDVDFTNGVRLDAYARGEGGTLDELFADSPAPIWKTEEIYGIVEWVRARNAAHPDDPVRIVGLEINAVRPLAYEAVLAWVREAAPERAGELERLYADLIPRRPIAEHIRAYRALADKQPLIDAARAAHALVAELPPSEGHALAERYAALVVAFHELHAGEGTNMGYIERWLAQNALWWHEQVGARIAFVSSSTHISNGRDRAVRFPPAPAGSDRNCGSYLRERLGAGYVPIGLTFHHGSLATYVSDEPVVLADAAPELVESVLGEAGPDAYLLPLAGPAADPLRAWLEAPARTRVVGYRYDPAIDGEHCMTGASLDEWFDALVHFRQVTPTRPVHNGSKGAR